MGFNDRITERFEVICDKSKQDILNSINEGKGKQELLDVFAENRVNYKAFNVIGDRLEILRTPTMLNPFRADGKITILVDEIESKKTRLSFELLPYNGILFVIIGLLIGFLVFLTLLAFLLSKSLKVLIITVPGGIVFGLILYLKYLYTRRGLKNYSNIIIDAITKP